MAQFLFVIQLLFIGTTELLLIGGVALLLFGGKKLPEMMRGLGQGVKEFKKGVNEDSEKHNETKGNSDDIESDGESKEIHTKSSQTENGKQQ